MTVWTSIGIFILLIVLLMGIMIVYYTLRSGISPMPSSSRVSKALESTLPDKMSGTIYELGSGWGALAFRLAALHPDAEVKAYEISPVPWSFSYARQKIYPYNNLRLHWEDFFRISFVDADAIVCYLYPGAMERLKEKFDQELKPGTLVISNTFAIPGWEPDRIIKVGDFYRTKIYVYKV